MEPRVYKSLREKICNDRRDIAVISAPGMGLTSLLSSLDRSPNIQFVWLKSSTILEFWEREYKTRAQNRRFVIHAATLRVLSDNHYLINELGDEELFSTNLRAALGSLKADVGCESPIHIGLDNFDELPTDLAGIICSELKAIDDLRSQSEYDRLKRIRFIMGGAIDIQSLFAQTQSGVSPATHLCKLRPYELLLQPEETRTLLAEEVPGFREVSKEIAEMVLEWTNGYLHYVRELAAWIMTQPNLGTLRIQDAILALKEVIEEQDHIPLFKYCYLSWEKVRHDESLVKLLEAAISVGHTYSVNPNAKQLASLGILIERPDKRFRYEPANKLIELFFRQRLAELGRVLSVGASASWTLTSLNASAYSLLLEIECRLRNYIGDHLFSRYGESWVNIQMNENFAKEGASLVKRAQERQLLDQNSIYASSVAMDSFLAFFDFPDLSLLVRWNPSAFPPKFSSELPAFIEELNYYRRRVAHNRFVTETQVENLKSRWRIIQRMMANRP